MLEQFIAWLLSWVNRAIYVWGGQGQETNEPDIRASETSIYNANRAITLYRKRKAQGICPIVKFDCSGLGVCFLLAHKLIPYDVTAQTMYKAFCDPVNKDQLKRGDWVFVKNLLGKITHIGYIVDNDLNVVEAKGRDYGVVKTALSAGSWNVFGRPKMFKAEIEYVKPAYTWGCSRLLKLTDPMQKGEDIRHLQEALKMEGYQIKVDGEFGPKTAAALEDYQAHHGLEADGIAGKASITALGGVWEGK